MRPVGKTNSEFIREEIQRRGWSYAEAARQSELDPAQVRRFVNGKGLTSEAIDRLTAALGLRLVRVKEEADLHLIAVRFDQAIHQLQELHDHIGSMLEWARGVRPKEPEAEA